MRPTWLKWLNPDDHRQLHWAGQYLARKGYYNFAPVNGYPLDGFAFIQGMACYEQDLAFRYIVDKMRAAWRQKQYRSRNGQQVAFQLPNRVCADLTRLAKSRGQAKVETLRQVISNAADQHVQEKKEVKKVKETHTKKLQTLEKEHNQKVEAHRRLNVYLLEALAGELHQRCRLEALVGEWGNSSLEDDESLEAYHALVAKRVAKLEAEVEKIKKLARLGGTSLSQLMRALADRYGIAQPSADRPPEKT